VRTGLGTAAGLSVAAFVFAALVPMPTQPAEPDEPAEPRPAFRTVAEEVEPSSAPQEPEQPDESEAPGDPASERPRRFDVVLTGDVLLHEGLWDTARRDGGTSGRGGLDFRPMLAPMRPTIEGADLAVCHLETPLAPARGPYSGYPSFSAPPQIAPALTWAGYDACTTASNHTVDTGFEGLVRTVGVLDRTGLAHTGSFATKRAANTPTLVEVATDDGRTVTVGLVSATYGLNGLPVPSEAPWSVELIDVPRIVAKARAAKQAGADVVLVALHWGTDGYAPITDEQRRVADLLTRSKAIDLVYGHHAHIVQPIEKVNGRWVIFGLGNAIAQQDSASPELYEGLAARVAFGETPSGRFEIVRIGARPTLMTPFGADPMRYLDVGRALVHPAWAGLRQRLLAARSAVLVRVGLPRG
jgi:hypothetical protein